MAELSYSRAEFLFLPFGRAKGTKLPAVAAEARYPMDPQCLSYKCTKRDEMQAGTEPEYLRNE